MTATLPLSAAPKLWDEFAPNLYTLSASLGDDARSVPVGFRTLTRAGQHLAVNGRTTLIRGNMEHLIFPLTGRPPTDVASWRRVFQVYKDYGFNQMRCHSCTPPDAAFTAADQMGIYIQAETFWMQYPLGSGKPVGEMKKHEPAMPASFAYSDQSPDDYVHAELRRVEDTYGNHPSLVFVVIGNELGKSDWPVTGRWIAEEKAYDPRHWYAASTARQITPADDFNDTHAVPKVGLVRDRLEAFNDWDYASLYAKAPVPIIAHELGQWPTYPRWSEFDAFTGVAAPRDFAAMRASAAALGTVDQDEAFHNASGALAVRLYKDEMESHLRTTNCAGFSTLDMQDYPGQGEAMIGWLDALYRSKGTVTPERFRRWCGPTVTLARLPKYVYAAGEPITGSAVVAHYGPADLHAAESKWRLLGRRQRRDRRGEVRAARRADGRRHAARHVRHPRRPRPGPRAAGGVARRGIDHGRQRLGPVGDVGCADDRPGRRGRHRLGRRGKGRAGGRQARRADGVQDRQQAEQDARRVQAGLLVRVVLPLERDAGGGRAERPPGAGPVPHRRPHRLGVGRPVQDGPRVRDRHAPGRPAADRPSRCPTST